MARVKGAGYTLHFDETLNEGIYKTQIPNISFLYETSTTKNPKFIIGDRVVLPDGRKYRYGLTDSDNVGAAGRLMFGGSLIPGIATTDGYEGSLTADAAIGTREVTLLDTVSRSVDHYAGGLLTAFPASGILTHRITESTAGDGTSITIKLEVGLPLAVTSSNGVTIYASPYRKLSQTNGTTNFKTAMGVAIVNASASSYCWIQVAGPAWVTATAWGSTGPGCAAGFRDVYANSDGTIMPKKDDQGLATQRVGTVLYMGDGSAYGDGVINLDLDLG